MGACVQLRAALLIFATQAAGSIRIEGKPQSWRLYHVHKGSNIGVARREARGSVRVESGLGGAQAWGKRAREAEHAHALQNTGQGVPVARECRAYAVLRNFLERRWCLVLYAECMLVGCGEPRSAGRCAHCYTDQQKKRERVGEWKPQFGSQNAGVDEMSPAARYFFGISG